MLHRYRARFHQRSDLVGGGPGRRRRGRCKSSVASANHFYWSFDAGVSLVEFNQDFRGVGKLKVAAKREHFDGLRRAQESLAREVDPETSMGAAMTDVLDGETERDPWHGDTWAAIPGHYGRPRVLLLVGGHYRYLDWTH